MKNLFVYYVQILLPLPLIYISSEFGNSSFFVGLLAFYLIYRIFVDYYRLVKKGLMEKKYFFKILIPFWRTQFFKELYFEN